MSHLPRASLATIAAAVVLAVTVSCQSAQQPGAASSPSPSPDMAQGGPSAAEWKELGKTFMFEGHPVFYVDQGSGMVTLAIHGYPTSSWDFRRLLAPLSRDSRLIAPDLLGFGYSAKPADIDYTIARHADMVAALGKHLGLTRARLIGSDIGNAVVQELLARERSAELPFAIDSVALINGSLFAEQFTPNMTQKALLSPLGGIVNWSASQSALAKSLAEITGPDRRIPASELATTWQLLDHPAGSRLMHKTLPKPAERAANDARWTDALCGSTTPVKLIVGAADPTAGKSMAEAIAGKCGGARPFSVSRIEKAGHFPHVEYAEETAAAILAWRAGGY
jgi:pimeloyl-ACP methyl ester carboxylesterase